MFVSKGFPFYTFPKFFLVNCNTQFTSINIMGGVSHSRNLSVYLSNLLKHQQTLSSPSKIYTLLVIWRLSQGGEWCENVYSKCKLFRGESHRLLYAMYHKDANNMTQTPTQRCRHRPATLLKTWFWHRCFPVNFARFLRTLFSYRTPLVAASVLNV